MPDLHKRVHYIRCSRLFGPIYYISFKFLLIKFNRLFGFNSEKDLRKMKKFAYDLMSENLNIKSP